MFHWPLENVVEIRFGAAARLTRESLQLSSSLEPRWLTVVYTLDSRWKILNVVAPDEAVCILLFMPLMNPTLIIDM